MTVREALETLELRPPITEEALRIGYRKAAKRFHPDRYAAYDKKAWASENFIHLKKAYDLLRGMRLDSITDLAATDSVEWQGASSSERRTVFNNYSDQSEFTDRDFIAWLSLWRLAVALFRMLARPLGGESFNNSSGFQTTVGCLFLLLLIPFMYFVFPVLYFGVIFFGLYIILQKGLASLIGRVFGLRIGPESSRLVGQLIYLSILASGAVSAIGFAIYVLPTEKNREWMGDAITWSFTAILVLTSLLESILFVKVQLFKRKFKDDLRSAIDESV
jgi:hypothetical protein